MRTRVCDWYDKKSGKPKYGFEVFHKGEWRHAAENGELCLFDTARQRDKKRGEFRRLKVTPNDKYGRPGHKLWVRETFVIGYDVGDRKNLSVIPWSGSDPQRDGKVIYKADGKHDDESKGKMPWRRSIHMPRWASRITLEITKVRVERLQDITEADAKAEGAPIDSYLNAYTIPLSHIAYSLRHKSHHYGFQVLWGQIYGHDSWRANPWVWVIEFKRVDTAPIGGKA